MLGYVCCVSYKLLFHGPSRLQGPMSTPGCPFGSHVLDAMRGVAFCHTLSPSPMPLL